MLKSYKLIFSIGILLGVNRTKYKNGCQTIIARFIDRETVHYFSKNEFHRHTLTVQLFNYFSINYREINEYYRLNNLFINFSIFFMGNKYCKR